MTLLIKREGFYFFASGLFRLHRGFHAWQPVLSIIECSMAGTKLDNIYFIDKTVGIFPYRCYFVTQSCRMLKASPLKQKNERDEFIYAC